jgi:hypothetical protein
MSEKKSVIPDILANESVTGIKEPKRRSTEKLDEEVLFVKVNIAAMKQLRVLCAEEGISQKRAISEALNMLFSRYSKPPIA